MGKIDDLFNFCGEEYGELNQRIKDKFDIEENRKLYFIAVASMINSQVCILHVLRNAKKKKRKKIFNKIMKDFEQEIFDTLREEEKNNNLTYNLLEALVSASFQQG